MRALGFLLLFFFFVTTTAHASIIANQQYRLLDHPDGVLNKPPEMDLSGPYGIRLDSQKSNLGGNGTNAAATFSVEANNAFASFIWDGGSSVRITGTVTRNSDGSSWLLDYLLTGVTAVAGPNGGFTADMGSGTLVNGMNVFNLTGQDNNEGFVFIALSDGHRLPGDTDPTARGWLDGSGTNDWLVQLTPVPLPAALPLLISGLLGFFVISRKKAVIS